ncbi:hypothetical protein Dform_00501 [Dehalogenimonas formicexedens]|uniref:Uncharacterized protein n=2 Tax=Dehalogenimonas TaxID=670486 RepID=A0A1P8F5U3_9CHLR|nr:MULTISPECIES: hypothetical protein [Dehalogenimonas]APV43856.1 hypothetical protein Dform_00501 [Dehalogenimonas formicexedens]KTB49325.1 hypothetical protein DEALK_02380 [Dehalogenimonas alkenigignens]
MDIEHNLHLAKMIEYLHHNTSPQDRVILRNMSAVIDGRITRTAQLEGKTLIPSSSSRQHPPPVDMFGVVLGASIEEFCWNHNPEIRYTGRRTAIDALTSCVAPNGEEYSFHYEVDRYTKHGVYVRRVAGVGFKTSAQETDELRRCAGFPPFKRRIRKAK